MAHYHDNSPGEWISRPTLVGRLEERHTCTLCRQLLHRPVQTSCGHRYCRECVTKTRDQSATCVSDQDEECKKAKLDEVFEDKGMAREISNLPARCSACGCTFTAKFKDIPAHEKTCDFIELSCPNPDCNETIKRKNLQLHIDADCPYTRLRCDICSEEIILRKFKSHVELCKLSPQACKYKKYGCSFTGFSDDLKSHQADATIHFELILKHNEGTESKLSTICDNLNSVMEENNVLREQLHGISTEMQHIRSDSTTRNQDILKAVARAAEKVEKLELKVKDTEQGGASAQNGGIENGAVQNLRDLCRIIEGKVQHLDNAVNSSKTTISTLETSMGMADVRIAEYDIRYRCLETASFDGTLIWKIKRFAQRKCDAVAGRTLSIYSQPFYTSRHGYQLCARAYLNGDGLGLRTHLSLFFVVMRGEYDALLQWPFRHKITLTLLDQNGGHKHISDTFRPDPTSSSFRKPVGAMNIASGCPLFVAQNVVEQSPYLVDDTIFIKVQVDTSKI